MRDRVRAKGAAVCDAAARDAVEADAHAAALCLGAVRRLSWGESRGRAENLLLAASADDPRRGAAASAD